MNSAYFFNYTTRRGAGIFAAQSVKRDTLHTGKDAPRRARDRIRYREASVLASRRSAPVGTTSYWCDADVAVEGKEFGQVFLPGTMFARRDEAVSAATRFRVWDQKSLRTIEFVYNGTASAKGIALLRFVPSPANYLNQSVAVFGPSPPGLYNLSCPLTDVPVFVSLPRCASLRLFARAPSALSRSLALTRTRALSLSLSQVPRRDACARVAAAGAAGCIARRAPALPRHRAALRRGVRRRRALSCERADEL